MTFIVGAACWMFDRRAPAAAQWIVLWGPGLAGSAEPSAEVPLDEW